MDTNKKGDKLELQIYDFFKAEISKGGFYAPKECCRVYAKKGYFSKDRGTDIIFDVSIEVFLPGLKTYSHLVLIECKNYTGHKVSVDEVEEFFSKIQQISGANVKGIVVSTDAFQSGAITYSQSKGFGLVRYFDKSKLDWVLTRSPSSLTPTNNSEEYFIPRSGICTQTFKSDFFDFYGYFTRKYTNSIRLFFSELLHHSLDRKLSESLSAIETVDTSNSYMVPFIEISNIEELCEVIFGKIDYSDGAVNLGHICDSLREKKGLLLNTGSSLRNGVLGEVKFDPFEIRIDSQQCETEATQRFTLAHELGHFLLQHSRYLTKELCHKSDLEINDPPDIKLKDIKRMEWQANYFASSLLLPKKQLLNLFMELAVKYGLKDKGFGLLYLDAQRCNYSKYRLVTEPLVKQFNVSSTMVKIRLKRLGLLNEETVGPLRPCR